MFISLLIYLLFSSSFLNFLFSRLAKTTAPDLLASAFLDKDILFSSITNDPNFDFDEEDIPYYDAMFEEKKQETENEKEENGDGNEEVKEKRKEVGWGEVFGAFVGACEGFFSFSFLLLKIPFVFLMPSLELTSKCFVLLLSSFEEKLLFSLRDPERGFSLPHVVASMGKVSTPLPSLLLSHSLYFPTITSLSSTEKNFKRNDFSWLSNGRP